MTVLTEILLVVGAALMVLAGIGVTRFDGVLSRMHALSKASALGVVLVFAGGFVGIDGSDNRTMLVLAGILQLLTSPVAANLLGRAIYRADGISSGVDSVDELAEWSARRAEVDGGDERPVV